MMIRALIAGGLVVLLLIPATVLLMKATKPDVQVDGSKPSVQVDAPKPPLRANDPRAALTVPQSVLAARAAMDAPYQEALKKLDEKQSAELAALEKGSLEKMEPNIRILQKGAALESCNQQSFLSLQEYGPKFMKYQDLVHAGQAKDIQEFITKGVVGITYIDPEIVKKHLVYARIIKIQTSADEIKAKLRETPTSKEECEKVKTDIDTAIETNKQ